MPGAFASGFSAFFLFDRWFLVVFLVFFGDFSFCSINFHIFWVVLYDCFGNWCLLFVVGCFLGCLSETHHSPCLRQVGCWRKIEKSPQCCSGSGDLHET